MESLVTMTTRLAVARDESGEVFRLLLSPLTQPTKTPGLPAGSRLQRSPKPL
jgi:hypothetical protein